jgi:anionic cell wall polymer biosynthesis LytR-Cps2A-Psr (LCP) family protein
VSGKHGRARAKTRGELEAPSLSVATSSRRRHTTASARHAAKLAPEARAAAIIDTQPWTTPLPPTAGDAFTANDTAGLIRLTSVASNDAIVPHSVGSRRAAREEKLAARRKRTFTLGGAVLVVALAVLAVFGWSGSSRKHAPAAVAAGRTQTTLLIQVKAPTGEAVDSALVAHDSRQHAGVLVLVPSQVIGRVPGFGSMPFGKALAVAQAAGSSSTLSDLMGVTVDGSWVLTQQGFQQLIDKIGGVAVSVDKDITKAGADGTTTIVVPAGQQKLNGANAVAFATFLDNGETEQLRLARFDAVFAAVLAQLPKQPAAVASLLSSLGAGSVSSLPVTRVADLLVGLAADTAANSTVDTVLPVTKLDVGDDENAFSVDATKTSDLVKQQLGSSIPANHKVTGNRVSVENQIGTPGIGETTRAKLLRAGFTYLPGGNAPGMPNATAPSVVLILGTTSADIAKGDAVAKALGLPTADVKVSRDDVRVADVIVLLGADYKP